MQPLVEASGARHVSEPLNVPLFLPAFCAGLLELTCRAAHVPNRRRWNGPSEWDSKETASMCRFHPRDRSVEQMFDPRVPRVGIS